MNVGRKILAAARLSGRSSLKRAPESRLNAPSRSRSAAGRSKAFCGADARVRATKDFGDHLTAPLARPAALRRRRGSLIGFAVETDR